MKYRVAIVDGIQHIPPQPMLLFYTYGDNYDTAKYPGTIIFFTIELEVELTAEISKEYNESVSKISAFMENYFKELWGSELHYDILNPLLARIANNLFLTIILISVIEIQNIKLYYLL